MRTPIRLLGALALLAAMLGGAGVVAGLHPGTASAATGDHVVSVPGDRFVPFALTVTVGDTVTWQNTDTDPHTVETVPGQAPAPIDLTLDPGSSGSFTFTVPGVYHYYCSAHASLDSKTGQVGALPSVDNPAEPMEGVILVQGPVPDAPAAATVSIPGDSVNPFITTVTAGGTVTWHNADTDPHTVVSVPGNSPAPINLMVQPDADQSITFTTPGLYWYYCNVHAAWDEATGQVGALPSADAPNEPMMGLVAVVQGQPLAGGAGSANATPEQAGGALSTSTSSQGGGSSGWLIGVLAAAGAVVVAGGGVFAFWRISDKK